MNEQDKAAINKLVTAWCFSRSRQEGNRAQEQLLALVDRIADARVLAFARGALLAGEAGSPVTDGINSNAVVAHIHNTVAQIALLEKDR